MRPILDMRVRPCSVLRCTAILYVARIACAYTNVLQVSESNLRRLCTTVILCTNSLAMVRIGSFSKCYMSANPITLWSLFTKRD